MARQLARIAEALERRLPPESPCHLEEGDCFVWRGEPQRLESVARIDPVALDLLRGIDYQRDRLLENTRRFAAGLPANNALLWGARGMGKSSLVKAVYAAIRTTHPAFALVEILREDLNGLPALLRILAGQRRQILLFCDDLSFSGHDTQYKTLKTVLDGGIEGRPANVLLYATSNQRHLMPRAMIENEQGSAIHPGEIVEEKLSLSDRFGLWLGFYVCDQDAYLEMVARYAAAYGLAVAPEILRAQALEWSVGRGSRSGRVAWQFIQDLAGGLGQRLDAAYPDRP